MNPRNYFMLKINFKVKQQMLPWNIPRSFHAMLSSVQLEEWLFQTRYWFLSGDKEESKREKYCRRLWEKKKLTHSSVLE